MLSSCLVRCQVSATYLIIGITHWLYILVFGDRGGLTFLILEVLAECTPAHSYSAPDFYFWSESAPTISPRSLYSFSCSSFAFPKLKRVLPICLFIITLVLFVIIFNPTDMVSEFISGSIFFSGGLQTHLARLYCLQPVYCNPVFYL